MNAHNPKTVIAANSPGRDKAMDLDEYLRRAVTDHRCMARTQEQKETAERLYKQQVEFATECFESLYAEQNDLPDPNLEEISDEDMKIAWEAMYDEAGSMSVNERAEYMMSMMTKAEIRELVAEMKEE